MLSMHSMVSPQIRDAARCLSQLLRHGTLTGHWANVACDDDGDGIGEHALAGTGRGCVIAINGSGGELWAYQARHHCRNRNGSVSRTDVGE